MKKIELEIDGVKREINLMTPKGSLAFKAMGVITSLQGMMEGEKINLSEKDFEKLQELAEIVIVDQKNILNELDFGQIISLLGDFSEVVAGEDLTKLGTDKPEELSADEKAVEVKKK